MPSAGAVNTNASIPASTIAPAARTLGMFLICDILLISSLQSFVQLISYLRTEFSPPTWIVLGALMESTFLRILCAGVFAVRVDDHRTRGCGLEHPTFVATPTPFPVSIIDAM